MRILLLLLLTLGTTLTHAKVNAKKIMQAVEDRETGEDFIALYKMDIINKGKTKTRELIWWRLNNKNSTKNMIKIKAPKPLKNTGLLIHSNKKGSDKTWLYLSKSAKKVPRIISSKNRDSRFLGSDFYYVDFEEGGVDEFKYKYIKKGKLKKETVHIIESTPLAKDNPYSKTISYVDAKTFVVLKIEIYKKGKKTKEKTFSVLETEKIQGIITIKKSEMVHHAKNRKTLMDLDQIKYNNKLKSELFSTTGLTNEI